MDIAAESNSIVSRMCIRALIERVDQVRVLAAAELDASFSTEAARAALILAKLLEERPSFLLGPVPFEGG